MSTACRNLIVAALLGLLGMAAQQFTIENLKKEVGYLNAVNNSLRMTCGDSSPVPAGEERKI